MNLAAIRYISMRAVLSSVERLTREAREVITMRLRTGSYSESIRTLNLVGDERVDEDRGDEIEGERPDAGAPPARGH